MATEPGPSRHFWQPQSQSGSVWWLSDPGMGSDDLRHHVLVATRSFQKDWCTGEDQVSGESADAYHHRKIQ